MTTPFVGPLTRLFAPRLGQTTDPRDLIPGSPETIEESARTLTACGDSMDDNAQGLRRVDAAGWHGPAAGAFWDDFGQDPPRWGQGAEAMRAAAAALQGHAEMLRWGQEQAQVAIDRWQYGQTVTDHARTEHAAAVTAAQAAGAGAGVARPLPAAVFVDPGAAIRQEAEEILARARDQVDDSARRAATVLGEHAGQDGASWLSRLASVVDTALRDYDTGAGTLKFDKNGSFKDWEITLGDLDDARLQVWGWDGEGSTQFGGLTLAGDAELNTLGVSGTGGLVVNGSDGLKGELSGEAYLLHGEAEGSVEWGMTEVGAKGEVFVGAEAGVEASVGPDGVNVGAEAFAGARAEGEVYADVGGIGVGAKGEAWAGVGAEASATFGRNDDGTWTIGAEAGAALKAGGKLGFEITIDPPKIIDTVTDAASSVGDFAGDVVDTLKFW